MRTFINVSLFYCKQSIFGGGDDSFVFLNILRACDVLNDLELCKVCRRAAAYYDHTLYLLGSLSTAKCVKSAQGAERTTKSWRRKEKYKRIVALSLFHI